MLGANLAATVEAHDHTPVTPAVSAVRDQVTNLPETCELPVRVHLISDKPDAATDTPIALHCFEP